MSLRTGVIAVIVAAAAAFVYAAAPTPHAGCKPMTITTAPVRARGTDDAALGALRLQATARARGLHTAHVYFDLLAAPGGQPLAGGSGITDEQGRATFDAGLGLGDDPDTMRQLTAARYLRVHADLRFRGFCAAETLVPFSYSP